MTDLLSYSLLSKKTLRRIFKIILHAVLRIRIRDPGSGIGCLFDPWIRDPGWEKVSIRIRDPGWPTRIIFFRALETIFLLFWGLKYLNSLMRIRDPRWRQFGSGIRDKHPGSATLPPRFIIYHRNHRFKTIHFSALDDILLYREFKIVTRKMWITYFISFFFISLYSTFNFFCSCCAAACGARASQCHPVTAATAETGEETEGQRFSM